MHFRVRYIVADFEFGDSRITVLDPEKRINVVISKRSAEDTHPAFEAGDGIALATCERQIPTRHHDEAVASGSLSVKKEAVARVGREMEDLILHTLRLVRWRTNCSNARPNPIRYATDFSWSLDEIEWKAIADNLSFKIEQQLIPYLNDEAAEFVRTRVLGEEDEPLGHQLLREASVNRKVNPRSSLVLAVAAAEVGFKRFAAKALPDSAWVLDLPAPPLFDMISAFPWEKLGVTINGKTPTIPDSLKAELKKAVTLRNKIVHTGTPVLSSDTLDSVLTSVRDLLYLLDALRGNKWALRHVSPRVRECIIPAMEPNRADALS
jgi:hypothetical protein